MTKHKEVSLILISYGTTVSNLHYGPFSHGTESGSELYYPIRLDTRILTKLNDKEFLLHVVPTKKQLLGYVCEPGHTFSNIESNSKQGIALNIFIPRNL